MIKVTVNIEEREDGGIRVSSNEMPGLILSGSDPDAVSANIWRAVKVLHGLRESKERADRKRPTSAYEVMADHFGLSKSGD